MISNRYIKIEKSSIESSLFGSKLFSRSLQDDSVILKEFNGLTNNQREKIKSEYENRGDVLRGAINGNEAVWETLIMVEANIIAAKYDIDPATVILCLTDICKSYEKIISIY